MSVKGLPGIEVLFRDHIRLSKKLSGEELVAIRRFIGDRLEQEHQGLLFRIRHLKAAQDLNEREYQRSLSLLQRELDKEKWIAHEFQREFGSLAKVLQQRDERYRLKHETLIADLKKARQGLSNTDDVKQRLSNEIKQKDCIIHELEIKANQLRDSHRKKCDALEKRFSEGAEKLHKEILKLKFEIDQKNKEISNLRADLYEKKLEKHVKFQGGICDDCTCRARGDLEKCRAQLVQRCKEITMLKFQIEQGKQKIREQSKVLAYLSPVMRQREGDARNNSSKSRRQDTCTLRNVRPPVNRR